MPFPLFYGERLQFRHRCFKAVLLLDISPQKITVQLVAVVAGDVQAKFLFPQSIDSIGHFQRCRPTVCQIADKTKQPARRMNGNAVFPLIVHFFRELSEFRHAAVYIPNDIDFHDIRSLYNKFKSKVDVNFRFILLIDK
ncbi:hypothetical protein BCO26_0845 [Heyndrickxia coagulans 2-6]|nr:hypothetical protein BCO26_0845 [Heyndrickxia coagulans 2-6]